MTLQSDSELREQVQSLLHRVRTRSLHEAPIYLSHINEIEGDVLQLIKARDEAREREIRLDELNRIDPTQSLAVLTKDDEGKPEWVNRRIAALSQPSNQKSEE